MSLLLNQQQINFTQGDQVTLTLMAANDFGSPINLTGATFSTEINGPNGSGPITFGNSQHSLGSSTGQFLLALASTDTANCGEGVNKEIVTAITISGVTQYYKGISILNVWPAPPNP